MDSAIFDKIVTPSVTSVINNDIKTFLQFFNLNYFKKKYSSNHMLKYRTMLKVNHYKIIHEKN
jgi:hypothetical protein